LKLSGPKLIWRKGNGRRKSIWHVELFSTDCSCRDQQTEETQCL